MTRSSIRFTRVFTRSSARKSARFTGTAITVAAAAMLASATPASAHIGGPTHGLVDGLMHPLTGPDHLLAMLAVGIVATLSASDRATSATMRRLLVPTTFLVAMVVGGALGIAGISSPMVEVTIVGSVIALGVAVALANERATSWLLPLVAIAGLAHGNAHGVEAPTSAHPALYVAGFVLATAMLHAVGVLSGTVLSRRPALRMTIAAVVASAGVLLLF